MLTEYGGFCPEKNVSQGLRPNTGKVILGSVDFKVPGDSDSVRQSFGSAVREVRCYKKGLRDECEHTHKLLHIYPEGPPGTCQRSPRVPQKAGNL